MTDKIETCFLCKKPVPSSSRPLSKEPFWGQEPHYVELYIQSSEYHAPAHAECAKQLAAYLDTLGARVE